VEGGGNGEGRTGEELVMLATGCAPPLPEDWCMGIYWKSGEETKAEMDILSLWMEAEKELMERSKTILRRGLG
jgi:hypothetical protein